MSSILKIEFEKLRKTKSFWAIMLFLVFITSTVAITRSLEVGGSVGGINPAEPRAENGYFFEDNSAYAISFYNVWIGSISGDLFFTTIFYFILPLAATLPFSFSLSDESKSGYLRQMTLKKGQMRYYFAKYIVTFTSGFLLAAIPLLINVIITACYIPAYKPDPLEQLYSGQYYGQYLANIFYSEPFAFMIIFILIPGLFCGLWADLSMCLSFFIKNKFFVVIIPYLFLFFEKAFFDSLFSNRIALDLSPFYFMRGESSGNIVIVTIILITMLGVTLFITWFRGWRDDVY